MYTIKVLDNLLQVYLHRPILLPHVQPMKHSPNSPHSTIHTEYSSSLEAEESLNSCIHANRPS